MRLLLDPSLPDSARQLRLDDFWDGLKRPLKAEDVPADVIAESGETAEKYYEQYVLLAQPFVKDGSRTIEDKIKETVAKVRENLVVRRFVRYEIGG